jgi:hypothetical protein
MPYDETLPGLEDIAWAKAAQAEGGWIAYVAEAEVVHVHDEDRRAVYNRYRREAMALKQILPQEHFRVTDLARLYLSNVLMDAWHALQERVLLAKIGEIAWFRWMQFWGTYRGFAESGPLTRQLKEAFYYPRGLSRRRGSAGRSVAPIDYRATRAETQVDPSGQAYTRGDGQGGALRRR